VLKMVRIINEMKEDMNKHLNKNQREYEWTGKLIQREYKDTTKWTQKK
jgi:hypothetical protein